jgi:hypothetical protein
MRGERDEGPASLEPLRSAYVGTSRPRLSWRNLAVTPSAVIWQDSLFTHGQAPCATVIPAIALATHSLTT